MALPWSDSNDAVAGCLPIFCSVSKELLHQSDFSGIEVAWKEGEAPGFI